jgi:hypothetical protein
LKPWFVAIVGEEETEQRFLKSTSDLAEMVDKAAQERAEWHLGADTADFMAKAVLRLRSMMRDVQRAWSQARATATCTKWVKVFLSAHAADLAAYTIDVGKNAKRRLEGSWAFGWDDDLQVATRTASLSGLNIEYSVRVARPLLFFVSIGDSTELCHRTVLHGNPTMDESLNLLLRNGVDEMQSEDGSLPRPRQRQRITSPTRVDTSESKRDNDGVDAEPCPQERIQAQVLERIHTDALCSERRL